MSDSKLETIVVLKPTSAEAPNNDIYQVARQIFMPDPQSAQSLIELLNLINLEQSTGIDCLEVKKPIDVCFNKYKPISLVSAEKIAVDLNCNILGGIFLVYLNSFGIDIGKVLGRSQIAYADKEFTLALYSNPKTLLYFNEPAKLTKEDRILIESVLYNNTGQFLTVEVSNYISSLTTSDSFAKVTFLKRVFRYAAEHTIKWTGKTYLRDNLVHSPDTPDEVISHREALALKYIEQ